MDRAQPTWLAGDLHRCAQCERSYQDADPQERPQRCRRHSSHHADRLVRGGALFCRPCLDWTERRPHIGGAVGAALAKRCFELKWIKRARDSRALTITPAGHVGLMEQFTLSI